MHKDQKRILQKIADGVVQDSTISDELVIDIYRVRSCLNELENSGYIKQKKIITFDTVDSDEHHLVTIITPEGRLFLRNELTIYRIDNNNFSPQINHIYTAKIGMIQQFSNLNEIKKEYSKEVIEMETDAQDYQYVIEQDRKRFTVLKAIYMDSKGHKDQATGTDDICQTTGICSEELLHILEFLESKGLIKPVGTLYAMYGGTACVKITHGGMCEVEDAIKKPNESTRNFPAQFFQNTFKAPVGVFQQAGQGNTLNIVQNIGSDEISLDSQSLDQLQRFVDTLIKNPPDDITKSLAYQAAGILLELKDSAENKDKKGQIEAVSKWKQWLNGVGGKTQQALSLVADCVSLALPLAKILGFPVP